MVLTERMQALGGHARSSHQRVLAEQRQETKRSELGGRDGDDATQDHFDSAEFESGEIDSGQNDSVQMESGQMESGQRESGNGNGFEQAARAALRAARELSLPPEEIETIIVDRIEAHLSGKIPIETIDEFPDDDAGEDDATATALLDEISYDELPRVPAQQPANDSVGPVAASGDAAVSVQGEQDAQGAIEGAAVDESAGSAALAARSATFTEAAGESTSEAGTPQSASAPASSEEAGASSSPGLSANPGSSPASGAGSAAVAQPQSHGVATAGESDHDFAARRAIVHEWQNWSALNSDDAGDPNALAYFLRHLETRKPRLLDFAAEEKTQVIHTWLANAGCFEA